MRRRGVKPNLIQSARHAVIIRSRNKISRCHYYPTGRPMQTEKPEPRGPYSEQDVEELQRRASEMLGREVAVEEVKYLWETGMM